MDLEASCKEKLSSFRIKELKDVLTQLGLSKQGKKQELVDRILTLLSDEQAARLWSKKNTVAKEDVAKLVDDTYRKMQVSGASDLASKGQVSSDTSNLKVKGEHEDPFTPEMKVRCVCGNSLQTDSMIQCDDTRCNVWEHVGCVFVPDKPMDGNPPLSDSFYCEICRLTRADPFWVTVAHPLSPVKLTATNTPTDGTNPIQSVERQFQITRADKDLLAKQEYDVQAWCMLLNDKVLFRMQWPQFADLQVNGMPVRAINRPGSQLLGVNGRDDGPIITPCVRDGINRISLSGSDGRSFCFGVRLVKRRTLQQLNSMAPRWKWKGAEAKALAEPISKSVSELQLALAKTESLGSLSSCNVLLAVDAEQAELLDRCCFGRLVLSADKVKKWIQLTFEESFFLLYSLKCIKISLPGRCLKDQVVDTWLYMKSKRPNFPKYFKAYSHLRSKNWVLRSGLQYGVDFVAYRHHPSLVHSEYSVLVQSGDSDRLRVWSDIHCAVRLSGSVAKTLLTLYVNGNFKGEELNLPLCLETFTVEEQTISRWSPELSREDETKISKLIVSNLKTV